MTQRPIAGKKWRICRNGGTTQAAVGLDGVLYVIGGFRGSEVEPQTTVYRYDPRSNEWSEGGEMPTPRGAAGAAVAGGKMYVIGGYGSGGSQTANEVYDPATDTWEALSPMPTGRDHLGVVASGGKVYAVGGRVFFDRNRNLPANEMYDPATNTWERLAPMPTARSGIAGAAMGGHIYTFGGEGTMSQAFDQTEAYEAATDSWATMAPMPTGRHGMGAAVSGGRIYVITGGPGAGVTGSRVGVPRSAVNEVFIP